MSITTTAEVTAGVNDVMMKKFLVTAQQLCPYFTGQYEGEGMIVPHSNTFVAKWRRYEQLTPTTTALTALTGAESYPFRSGTQLTITDYTATVAKYGQVVSMNEEVDLLNPTQMGAEAMDRLGQSAGRSLNRLQRNLLEDNSTLVYVGDATTDGTVADKLTVQSIRSVCNTLARNSAVKFTPESDGSTIYGSSPIRPAFWGITHVDNEFDIRNLAGFHPVETYASHTATVMGEFGMVEGVRFIMTEEASQDADLGGAPGTALKSTTGSSADLYTTVIFGKEYHGSLGLGVEHVKNIYKAGDTLPAVEVISKARGSSGAMDPMNELATVAWKAWHAAAVLNANWGRGIRHAAGRIV